MGSYDEAMYFDQRLTERGIAHHFKSVPGTHNDALWKERISHGLSFHIQHFKKM